MNVLFIWLLSARIQPKKNKNDIRTFKLSRIRELRIGKIIPAAFSHAVREVCPCDPAPAVHAIGDFGATARQLYWQFFY